MNRRACSLTAIVMFAAATASAGGSLGSRIGTHAAELLLASDSLEDRLQGLERLRSIGTPLALELLTTTLEPGTKAVSSEERLVAVRALVERTDSPTARRSLVRVLGGHAVTATTRDALDQLAQATAAVGLARAGTPDALAALGKALEGNDREVHVALAALLAYPPRTLAPVVDGARVVSSGLVAALDELGDQRAFTILRDIVRTTPPELAAQAAIALTHLGDFETVQVARRWREPSEPTPLRLAAATIFALAHAPEAADAIGALLRDPSTSSAGATLALGYPSPALADEMSRLLPTATGDRATELVTALGRAGGTAAIRTLTSLLTDPREGPFAANALARMHDDGATRALERALEAPATRRLAARAGVVRRAVTGETLSHLDIVAANLAASSDPTDRAAGAAVLAAIHPARVAELLSSPDESVVQGAAACLLVAPASAAVDAARRLSDTSGATRDALALALVLPEAEDVATNAALMALIDAGGPGAALAARAVAARDEPESRDTVDALLKSSDPFIRAHAALGLGRSPDADAIGRLESAYRFETDPDVRAAIVRALSMRSESPRTRVLNFAATFDTDETVRTVARRALSGERLPPLATGDQVLWLPEAGDRKGSPGAPTFDVLVPGGLVLPLATGPDGLAVAPGLPRGPIAVRVALARQADKPVSKGRPR